MTKDDLLFVPLEQYDRSIGHGNIVSVKIVLPFLCQARCKFCFNNITRDTQKHDFDVFINNLRKSLLVIGSCFKNRKISIDVTGNEPTFTTKEIFLAFSDEIRDFKKAYSDIVDKVVMTTNGYRLMGLFDSSLDVFDIINLSLHHYNYDKRKKIFGTPIIPSNSDVYCITHELKKRGITTTSVAVVDSDNTTPLRFKSFVEDFSVFSKDMGFDNTRIRINYLNEVEKANRLFSVRFEGEETNVHPTLSKKHIKINGYDVTIYRGVKALTDYVYGVELVIDDDGKLYVDYSKKIQADCNKLRDFDRGIFIKQHKESV